jgi:hypothetical protein
VRLIGVDWTLEKSSDVLELMDKLDTFRGLDENGNNLAKAVVSGVIHIDSLTGDELAEMNARYPNITIDYKTIKVYVRFYDGNVLLSESLYAEGDTIVAPEAPTKESTAQYDYPFKGWSIDGVNVVEVGVAGKESVTYYALFDEALRYYTVRFLNGTTVLQTSTVAYGEMPVYTGAEPTPEVDYAFTGWAPDIVAVTGDVDYVAQFKFTKSVTRALIDRSIGRIYNEYVTTPGTNAFMQCANLSVADLPNITTITWMMFGDTNLTTLILRSPTMCVLGNTNAFDNTPIKNGHGYIYVPSALVDEYKAATNWSTYAGRIRAIEDYPEICG